jgi:hypothetical protein
LSFYTSEAALLLQTSLPAQQDKATLTFILLPKNLGSIVFYLQMLSINAEHNWSNYSFRKKTMSDIKVANLNLGSELFEDSENFLTDLDTTSVYGGAGADFPEYVGYGVKTLEYGILGFGINNIASLALNFSNLGDGTGGDNGGYGGTV